MVDLKILRPSSALFNLTWTIRHVIDAHSPLYGKTAQDLQDDETEIIVLLSGVDDVYGQTVHDRFSFNSDEIMFDHRFVNMFDRHEKNTPIIDYAKFDQIEALK